MVVLNMEQDMEVLSKLTEDQKVAFMKAFSRLAGADGHLDEDELAFIRSMARVYGISDKRVDEILKIDSDEEVVNAVKVIDNRRAALELIKRGHRLVTDDVVEIRKVSDETLVGSAPDITRHFIELRGIGIVDVKSMFGVQSVRETQNIDLVITLEDWSREKEYDRLGLEEEYTELLRKETKENL